MTSESSTNNRVVPIIGAASAGGVVIGILPDATPATANRYVTFAIPTGMGHARNVIIVHTAQALIAIGGSFGTISEMAIALKTGKRVVALGVCNPLPGAIIVKTADQAVLAAF